MKHVFKAKKLGLGKEKEGVWFDSDHCTKEEAIAEFKPHQGTTQRDDSYTGYEYNGQKYHNVTYLGEFEDNEVPHNDIQLLDSIFKRNKNKKCSVWVNIFSTLTVIVTDAMHT